MLHIMRIMDKHETKSNSHFYYEPERAALSIIFLTFITPQLSSSYG